MITAWTSHLSTEEEKKKFEGGVRSARFVLERLSDLMEADAKALADTETSQKVYDFPNWDYRQADANGYKRCLKHYLKLLNLDQKETNTDV